jgi:hypothetical protein
MSHAYIAARGRDGRPTAGATRPFSVQFDRFRPVR